MEPNEKRRMGKRLKNNMKMMKTWKQYMKLLRDGTLAPSLPYLEHDMAEERVASKVEQGGKQARQASKEARVEECHWRFSGDPRWSRTPQHTSMQPSSCSSVGVVWLPVRGPCCCLMDLCVSVRMCVCFFFVFFFFFMSSPLSCQTTDCWCAHTWPLGCFLLMWSAWLHGGLLRSFRLTLWQWLVVDSIDWWSLVGRGCMFPFFSIVWQGFAWCVRK